MHLSSVLIVAEKFRKWGGSMPKAIEFLKHLTEMCDKTGCECGCPLAIYESDELISCKFDKIWTMGDKELADLVNAVENWHQERRNK